MIELSTVALGLILLSAQIIWTWFKDQKRQLNEDFDRQFGHASKIYPSAKPLKVKPSRRSLGLTAPLYRAISR